MQQFIAFSLHHWELWLAFIFILLLLIATELHSKITGLPNVSPQEATMLINREDALVLDLRNSELYSKGYIVGSINIPLAELLTKLARLEKHKTNPIIIVTTTGQPSSKVGKLLRENGCKNIKQLQGGIAAWQSAKLPLKKS